MIALLVGLTAGAAAAWALLSVALAGHGIALITPRFEAQSFAAGRLVPLFDITASTGAGYYLAYPREQRSSRKIKLFRDWVLAEAATA